MTKFIVQGYRRIAVMMTVEADSQEEAIEMAKAGEYTHVDTEPDKDLYRPAWKAREA